MKKKFIISGVAVFLVALLCSSALFAFADSYPVFPDYDIYLDNGVVTSITEVSNLTPSWTLNTHNHGAYSKYYYPNSSGYYLFTSGSTLFYSHSDLIVFGIQDFPSVGSTLSLTRVYLDFTDSIDSVTISHTEYGVCKVVLPTDYNYYLVESFGVYSYPSTFWGRVNSTIVGIIASFSSFIVGCMSNPVLAVCVIVIPVFTLIVTVLFSVIPHRGRIKSKYKNSRRRR